ncbi:MAG: AAA family ATPase [Phycisphaerales bacterium]|nr:AAA family ATPase [Phycisphaerales bacterium]
MNALTPSLQDDIASLLELPAWAIMELKPGWSHDDQAWVFPERDAEGSVIGLVRRYRDGKQKAIQGSRRGLTIPDNLTQLQGPILVPEGASDVAAAVAVGIKAIGRPGAAAGADLIVQRFAEDDFILAGENDGGVGEKVGDSAARTAGLLGRSVRFARPPAEYKDLRDHVLGVGDDREAILAWYVDHAETVEPQSDPQAAVDSIPAPREMVLARNEFKPIPASALGSGEAIDFIWDGYVARGFITLMVGFWKAGKTTLLAHLLHATAGGGVVGGEVQAVKVLVIAEEGAGLWARRRDEIGIDDNVQFIIRPFKGRPQRTEWEGSVLEIANWVHDGQYDLVVIDTWQSVSPSPDENDSAKMMAALTPLHHITEAGAGVLLLHHPRKGDGTEGTASRGSGALPGFVDVIVELRRYDAKQHDDTRRVLTGLSRFDETPDEVVLDLREDGYHVVGSKADAMREDRVVVYDEILSGADSPMTADEVREQWPVTGIPKPGKRTVGGDLKAGSTTGSWDRRGEGKKGDPYRYSVSRKPPALSAGNESESPGANRASVPPSEGVRTSAVGRDTIRSNATGSR